MFKKSSLQFLAFVQASALVIYVLFVSWLINFIGDRVADDTGQFYGPVVMLLLFVVSAVVAGSLVLGKAGMMYMQKQQSPALRLVSWTVGWLALYFVLFALFVTNV